MHESDSDEAVIAGMKSQETDTGPHQLHMESWISCAPYERHLRMEIVEAADGKATVNMPFLVQYAQGAALMHGGALMSLADTALVMAIKSILPPYTHFVTVHAEVDYSKPVTQGIVTARAKLTTHAGRKVIGESSVFDESGEKVLTFSATFVIPRDAQIRHVTFADSEA